MGATATAQQRAVESSRERDEQQEQQKQGSMLAALQATLSLPSIAGSLPGMMLLLLVSVALVKSPTAFGTWLHQHAWKKPYKANKQVLEATHVIFALFSTVSTVMALYLRMWLPPKQLQQRHAMAIVPAQISAWTNLLFYAYELFGTQMMAHNTYLSLHHVFALVFFAGCLQQPQILCLPIALAYSLHSAVWVGLFLFRQQVMLLMVLCSVVLFVAVVVLYYSAAAHRSLSRIIPISAFAIVVVNYMNYCSDQYKGRFCPYKADPLLYYAEGKTGEAESVLAAFAVLGSLISCLCLALEFKTLGKEKQA